MNNQTSTVPTIPPPEVILPDAKKTSKSENVLAIGLVLVIGLVLFGGIYLIFGNNNNTQSQLSSIKNNKPNPSSSGITSSLAQENSQLQQKAPPTTYPSPTLTKLQVALLVGDNSKRTYDVYSILNAIYMFKTDKKTFPSSLTFTSCPSSKPCMISNMSGSGPEADLCTDLTPMYLRSLPIDQKKYKGPSDINIVCTTQYDTGYTVSVDEKNIVTVSAPLADLGKSISISK